MEQSLALEGWGLDHSVGWKLSRSLAVTAQGLRQQTRVRAALAASVAEPLPGSGRRLSFRALRVLAVLDSLETSLRTQLTGGFALWDKPAS